jgi:V/A-type H+/Na+-transporting ATPase subunit I
MIVPMKKVFILTQSKDSADVVKSLRALGLIHVENQEAPKGEDINSLHEDLAVIEKAIGILSLPEFYEKCDVRSARMLKDWRLTAKHLADSKSRYDQLYEYSTSLKEKISRWEAWGDFNPGDIAELSASGLNIKFYQIPLKELDAQGRGFVLKVVSTVKGMANCLLVSDDKISIPYKELEPPPLGLEQMKSKLAETYEIIENIKNEIRKYACYHERFMLIKEAFDKELELHEAARGMGRSDEISYLKGYIPLDQVEAISEYAAKEKCGIFITEPSDDDMVPTLIRTPKWASIIKPVYKLLEILPGYKELDVSPVFLLFLGLFFGMIIGDAGYGALYALLTLFVQIKLGARAKDKRIFFLLYFFSSWAIFWGVLTGTVFGQEWYIKAGYKAVIPVLNDTKFIQAFCFFLGAFHLTLGHIWQAVRKFPSLTALVDIGWIAVLWSAFFFARTLILNDPLPAFVNYALLAGVSLVVLFTNPQKNILKGIGEGLGTVALSIVNNFTDVVSYVRLFAVGLAGVAISDTVNTLSGVLGGDNPVSKVIILFLGHTINILLGPISVLVHGIRLNVLEFSGHVGLTWSGIPYRPLELTKE